MGDIQYVVVDEAHVAYREYGESGRLDVVMVAGALFPFEMLAEDRVAWRFLSGLTALGRLVVFDKRAIGLSDPITDWERPLQAQWAEDLLAVIGDAGLVRPVVVSWDPLGTARHAAATAPDAVGTLVLINPLASAASYVRRFTELAGSLLPDRGVAAAAFPSRIDDPSFVAWLSQSGRFGASPSSASRIWEHALSFDGPFTPPGITARTLVLHNRDSNQAEAEVREVVDAITCATLVSIPGRDVYPVAGDVDALITEISEFMTGSPSALAPERTVAAVLFTDLVDSTRRAASAGDAHWRDLLDAHDRSVTTIVRHHGSRVVKTTGDGVLALLPSASGAMDAAGSIIDALAAQGLEVRVGIHVGDVDVRGDDVSGLAVNVAARVMGHAGPGETLVSEAVRLATLGCGHRFEGLADVELRGVPGTWALARWRPASPGEERRTPTDPAP